MKEHSPWATRIAGELSEVIESEVRRLLSLTVHEIEAYTHDELKREVNLLASRSRSLNAELRQRRKRVPNADIAAVDGCCAGCPAHAVCRRLNSGCEAGVQAYRGKPQARRGGAQ